MTDQELMREAIALAKEAYADDEVPIGCVIAKDGEIVARARNRREKGKTALSHAELDAIRSACETLGGWRLFDCTLYVTLEPCPMCAGAILNARVQRVVFGAFDPKAGSLCSVQRMFDFPYNHKPQIEAGCMETECAQLLKTFFAGMRKGIRKTPLNPNWLNRHKEAVE